MKKYIIILTFVFAMSCDEFLDVKPTGVVIPSTVEDYDKLLNELRIGNWSWNNLMYMDPDFWLPEEHFNNIWEPHRRKQYLWDPNPYEVQDQDPDWNDRYKYIAEYNQIINEVDAAPLGRVPERMRALIKGEALAQRAFDFFLLINEYAPHYTSSANDLPGIPMPLTNDLQAQLPRTSVGEFYERIETDLLAALKLYEDNGAKAIIPEANFRPGTASIKALLAEVYLYKGDWANAEKYADESLNLYYFLYDLNDLELNDPDAIWWGFDNPELIYENDQRCLTWNRLFNRNFYDPAQLYHPDHLAIINQTTDRRFITMSGDITWYDYETSQSPNIVYIREWYASNAGFSVARTLLTSAEAKVRNNKGQGAIDRLNELAVYRFTTRGSTFTYTNEANALQEVKNERRRELYATGNNFIDLKRYHAYGETIPTFTRMIINIGPITLEPGSDKYVVPIPRVVQNANPNLK